MSALAALLFNDCGIPHPSAHLPRHRVDLLVSIATPSALYLHGARLYAAKLRWRAKRFLEPWCAEPEISGAHHFQRVTSEIGMRARTCPSSKTRCDTIEVLKKRGVLFGKVFDRVSVLERGHTGKWRSGNWRHQLCRSQRAMFSIGSR